MLQERLWPNTFVSEANLPNLVSEVRRALNDAASRGRFVRTVHGYGYAFSGAADEDSGDRQRRKPLVSYWLAWEALPIRFEKATTFWAGSLESASGSTCRASLDDTPAS
jgi:hypothetical protein